MADLARGVPIAAVELTIDDQAAADARADEDSHDIPRLAFEFGHVHAQHRNVTVVFHEHRHVQLFFQSLLERHILPSFQVRGKNDRAGWKVHRARRANTNAGHLL